MQIVPEELTFAILSAPLLQLQLHRSLLFVVVVEMPLKPTAAAGARAMTTPVTLCTFETIPVMKLIADAPQHWTRRLMESTRQLMMLTIIINNVGLNTGF